MFTKKQKKGRSDAQQPVVRAVATHLKIPKDTSMSSSQEGFYPQRLSKWNFTENKSLEKQNRSQNAQPLRRCTQVCPRSSSAASPVSSPLTGLSSTCGLTSATGSAPPGHSVCPRLLVTRSVIQNLLSIFRMPVSMQLLLHRGAASVCVLRAFCFSAAPRDY